jgi:hypothetical protein
MWAQYIGAWYPGSSSTADLLPNEVAETVDEMIQQGLRTMKKTLDRSSAGRGGSAIHAT